MKNNSRRKEVQSGKIKKIQQMENIYPHNESNTVNEKI